MLAELCCVALGDGVEGGLVVGVSCLECYSCWSNISFGFCHRSYGCLVDDIFRQAFAVEWADSEFLAVAFSFGVLFALLFGLHFPFVVAFDDDF